MPISFAPSMIIFINSDLAQEIIDTFVRQLFISQVMDKSTFDTNVTIFGGDGYYSSHIHQTGQRILVLLNLYDTSNRNLADIVLFAKSGLVTVLSNLYGPPNITLPIDKVYLTALTKLLGPPQPSIPTGYFDFNPNHIWPPPIPEPVD